MCFRRTSDCSFWEVFRLGYGLVSIVFRTPSWGSGVFSSCCIYVTGLIQAVLFYLRVVVLCSVGVACSGGLLVRVFSGFPP